VGVAIIVLKENKILIGESIGRNSNHFFRGVPGGHLESRETLVDCAKREVLEEAGIIIDNLKLISVYDFFRKDKNRSYITIGMQADWVSGIPRDSLDDTSYRRNWQWYSPGDVLKLPNLFPADRVLVERFQSGIIYETK
jgi:8-oxo-dGTP diphosphatase